MKSMKTREFILTTENFDLDYNQRLDNELIEEYITQDLEIPTECIESVKIQADQVNIKLSKSKRYFNDDWYVNLQRVA